MSPYGYSANPWSWQRGGGGRGWGGRGRGGGRGGGGRYGGGRPGPARGSRFVPLNPMYHLPAPPSNPPIALCGADRQTHHVMPTLCASPQSHLPRDGGNGVSERSAGDAEPRDGGLDCTVRNVHRDGGLCLPGTGGPLPTATAVSSRQSPGEGPEIHAPTGLFIGPREPRWLRRRRVRSEPRLVVPEGSGVPDEDWVAEGLPGAEHLATLLRQREGSVVGMNVGRSLDAIEDFARDRGLLSSTLSTALSEARAYVDAQGLIVVHPRYVDIPIDAARCPASVNGKLEDMLSSRSATLVMDTRGCWFHRIFTIPKSDGGIRAISDLREVNEAFPAPPSFKHPPPSTVAGRGRYATKFDIKSAFFQPRIAPALQRAFAFRTSDGSCLTYLGLPMGFSWSPFIFDLILRPIDLVAAAMGVSCTRYVDDVAVHADTPDQLAACLKSLFDLYHLAGWSVALSKTYLVAATAYVFLGVRVCNTDNSVAWASGKRRRVLRALHAIRATGTYTPARVREDAGRLSFLVEAIPAFRSFMRGLYEAAGPGEDPLPAGPRLWQDVLFWTSDEGVDVALRSWPLPHAARPTWRAATDASDQGVGWAEIIPPPGRSYPANPDGGFPLPPAAAGESSGARELMAIRALIEHLEQLGVLRDGDAVVITTDAQVAHYVTESGTARSSGTIRQAQLMARTLLRLNIVLSTRWVRRDLNTRADSASRPGGDESQFDPALRHEATRWGGLRALTADLFAAPANAAAPVYYTHDMARPVLPASMASVPP